jgi:hypothetical protein
MFWITLSNPDLGVYQFDLLFVKITVCQRRAFGSHDYESQIMKSSTECYITLRNTLRSLCYVALHVWQLHQNIT